MHKTMIWYYVCTFNTICEVKNYKMMSEIQYKNQK